MLKTRSTGVWFLNTSISCAVLYLLMSGNIFLGNVSLFLYAAERLVINCINNFWITEFIFFAWFGIRKCCSIIRKWWRSNLLSVVEKLWGSCIFFFICITLYLNLHKQHNICRHRLPSVCPLHYFFSILLPVSLLQPSSCLCCLFDSCSRQDCHRWWNGLL